MKKKRYKVTIKLEYVTTMDHEQTSMNKAVEEVKKVIDNYLRQGLDLKKIFDKPPRIKGVAKIYYDED